MDNSSENKPIWKVFAFMVALFALGTAFFEWMKSQNQQQSPPIKIENNPTFNNNPVYNTSTASNPTPQNNSYPDKRIEDLEKKISDLSQANKELIEKIVSNNDVQSEESDKNTDHLEYLSSGSKYEIAIDSRGLAMRSRPLTASETTEKNRCQREGTYSNWLTRIDEATHIGTIYEGEVVIYYRTEGRWNLIKQLSTGKVAYISAYYAGTSTLK